MPGGRACTPHCRSCRSVTPGSSPILCFCPVSGLLLFAAPCASASPCPSPCLAMLSAGQRLLPPAASPVRRGGHPGGGLGGCSLSPVTEQTWAYRARRLSLATWVQQHRKPRKLATLLTLTHKLCALAPATTPLLTIDIQTPHTLTPQTSAHQHCPFSSCARAHTPPPHVLYPCHCAHRTATWSPPPTWSARRSCWTAATPPSTWRTRPSEAP